MIDAVILAGGKGTRLKSISGQTPKVLKPIAGRPMLFHQLDQLSKNGVQHVLLTLGYGAEAVQHALQKYSTEMKIDVQVESEPLGTSGGIPAFKGQIAEACFIIYGDVFFDIDLQRMMRFHKANQAAATLCLHPNDHPFDSDCVLIDGKNQITDFSKPPHSTIPYPGNLVSAALYIVQREVLELIPKDRPSDWVKDVFPLALSQSKKIQGYRTLEYLKDMGTPERFLKVEKDILAGRPQRKAGPQKSFFLDRDGVLIQDRPYIAKHTDVQFLPKVPSAIRFLNQNDYGVFVVTNQPVVARGELTEEGLRELHRDLEGQLGQHGAWTDAIFYCPHHPDSGFPNEIPALKIKCECRKPQPGLIKQAAAEFQIHLKNSFLVGDRATDILAGKAMGLTTIGVRTGFACQDIQVGGAHPSRPDFLADDLHQAIDLTTHSVWNEAARKLMGKKVIFICGPSRSGKSVAAAMLSHELKVLGLINQVIHLDDWCDPSLQEATGLGRHPLDVIARDVGKMLRGESISLLPYDSRTRQKSPEVLTYVPAPILIFEGVSAFHVSQMLGAPAAHIYIESSQQTRQKRWLQLDVARGSTPEQSLKTFQFREQSEVQLIQSLKHIADFELQMPQPRSLE